MNMKHWTTGVLAAALLTVPALANDGDTNHEGYSKQHREYSIHTQYEWTTEPGQTIMFKNPVSFEGEVTGVTSSHRIIKADNDMTLSVPNMALIWNGDTQIFSQEAQIGDRVVLHLRQDEPYRVMTNNGDQLAIGGYDGVFFVPRAFVNDIALDQLDRDIYRDSADVDLDNDGRIDSEERNVRRYDNDLKSADE